MVWPGRSYASPRFRKKPACRKRRHVSKVTDSPSIEGAARKKVDFINAQASSGDELDLRDVVRKAAKKSLIGRLTKIPSALGGPLDAPMNEAVGSKNTRKQPPSASKIEPGSAIMVAVHRTGHSISPSSRRPIPMRLLTLTTKEAS